MVRQRSNYRRGGSPDGPVENRLTDDWPVYVAFLPAVLASAAIGITAAMALGTGSSWHPGSANSEGMKIMPGDDYVEGLAKLGIAKLPNHQPAAVVRSGPRGGPLPLTQLTRGCVLLG